MGPDALQLPDPFCYRPTDDHRLDIFCALTLWIVTTSKEWPPTTFCHLHHPDLTIWAFPCTNKLKTHPYVVQTSHEFPVWLPPIAVNALTTVETLAMEILPSPGFFEGQVVFMTYCSTKGAFRTGLVLR